MTFPSTRWSLIRASADGAAARVAWTELAQRYRPAIHAWFRARHGATAADDLTQAFFAASIANEWWSRADAARGGFRTYLRTLLHRFGARHAEHGAATAELADVADAGDGPDRAYDRDFARALVARALERLASEQPGAEALLAHVVERGDQGDLKQLAVDLGIPQNTLSQRLRRLRLRLRELLREEFLDLVDDPALVDGELAALRGVL